LLNKKVILGWKRSFYMAKKFDGRVALVTGGASGIGRTTARIFAREGAKVIVATDSNIKGGEETVKLIKDAGGEATFVKCDVSKESDVAAMVDKCVSLYGRLDYAFNNAGIGPDGKRVPVVNIVDCPEDIWDRTIDINLKGVFLCLKYEMRQMCKQKYGAIVNTSSIGAVNPPPGFCAYGASKAGINTLTRSAALEGAAFNVRVNTIMPGPTQGTLLFEYLTGTNPEVKKEFATMIPLKRVANPEDMAETVMYFCSDEAGFITGQCLAIDGGFSIS
jgi:NAD(P)-dependent dehydrogenase (short-subunit alcohol dehydrogenase family)